MKVFWLEQSEAELPDRNEWLSREEASCLARLRFAKRRQDWLLGRWTAKRAVATCLGLADAVNVLAQVEIRAAPSGQPEAYLHGRRVGVCLSLSHSGGKALCAIGPESAAVGCDLERIETRSDSFIADYFTSQEQEKILAASAERDRIATLLWSAKESALKALGEGLRLDTRAVEVELYSSLAMGDASRWETLRVHYLDRCFHGCWRIDEVYVRTIVASAQRLEPVEIGLGGGDDSDYYADVARVREALHS
jgi:4'-phosphopantetheinyl transferase